MVAPVYATINEGSATIVAKKWLDSDTNDSLRYHSKSKRLNIAPSLLVSLFDNAASIRHVSLCCVTRHRITRDLLAVVHILVAYRVDLGNYWFQIRVMHRWEHPHVRGTFQWGEKEGDTQ